MATREPSRPAGSRRILVAPDSFKGTHTALEVATAIAAGVARAGATPVVCPVADGGEGTLDVLLAARGGELVEVEVHDPLGRPISASFALLHGDARVAVVETAAAIGLDKLTEAERDPWAASTAGAGELIAAAAAAGAERILVATGGSATVDGGRGALDAIEPAGGVGECELVVLCDVETTWELCAGVYAPQKGADAALVERLVARLDRLAGELPRDPRGVARTGAAGGLSGALWAAHGARLESGAAYVLEACGFDSLLAEADAVVVGEGRLDAQSLEGKIVGEITSRAGAAGVPVHAIAGGNDLTHADAARLGLASVRQAGTLDELTLVGGALVSRGPAEN